MERGDIEAEHAELGTAERRCGGCGAEAPEGLKGIADGADAGGAGGAKDGAKHGRKDVQVLVCVDVGEPEAASLKKGDLSDGFGLDFIWTDAAGEQAAEKCAGSEMELAGAPVDERGKIARREDRFAVCEDNVAADAE